MDSNFVTDDDLQGMSEELDNADALFIPKESEEMERSRRRYEEIIKKRKNDIDVKI